MPVTKPFGVSCSASGCSARDTVDVRDAFSAVGWTWRPGREGLQALCPAHRVDDVPVDEIPAWVETVAYYELDEHGLRRHARRVDRRPLLVGESNPYGADPAFALYPEPRGASGDRLRQLVGMTDREYLRAFDRVNLLRAGKWNALMAKGAATALLELQPDGRPLVLLGARVARAFGFVAPVTAPRLHATTAALGGRLVLTLPHPSGRCRSWNDEATRARAAALLGAVLGPSAFSG